MNWQKLIARLCGRGLSQATIALICECGQSTISDLGKSQSKEPRFTLGTALLRLDAATDEELLEIISVAEKRVASEAQPSRSKPAPEPVAPAGA